MSIVGETLVKLMTHRLKCEPCPLFGKENREQVHDGRYLDELHRTFVVDELLGSSGNICPILQ